MGPPRSTNHRSFLCLCLAASTQGPGVLDKKNPRPGAWAFKEQGFRSLQSANLKGKQTAILFRRFGSLENCGYLKNWRRKKKKERKESTREEWKRRHIWGHFMPACRLNRVIKSNNHTSQQNANLTLMEKNPELSAKKPLVKSPDVLYSRALPGCSFIF